MKEIDVIILAGGRGSRLRKIIKDRPKPMADINGRPFLDLLIDSVSIFGARRIIICTGYMAEYIRSYYQHIDAQQVVIFSEEKVPLGTAGGLKNAAEFIHSKTFLVLNGDSYCPVNLLHFLKFHRSRKALVSITVLKSKDSTDYGSVILDKKQRILEFKEKSCQSGERYINSGVYLFEKEILSLIPNDTKYSLEEELFPLLAGKRLFGYFVDEELVDIGTPERYEYAKKYFMNLPNKTQV